MKRVVFLAVIVAALSAGVMWRILSQHSASQGLPAIQALTKRSDIISAIMATNRHDHSLKYSTDTAWRAEISAGSQGGKRVKALLATQISKQLTRDVAMSNGHVEQIMVMDVEGCLVAADHVTHDYDQSDEAKWLETVGAHSYHPHIEGSEAARRGRKDQISQAVRGPNGDIIGAVTLLWCNNDGGCL